MIPIELLLVTVILLITSNVQAIKFDQSQIIRRKLLSTFIIPISLVNSNPILLYNANADTSSSTVIVKNEKYPLFNEVWSLVDENFIEPVQDWNRVYKKAMDRLSSGGDEKGEVKKALKLLGDKYTRLLDKSFYESLWKYDAVGVGLLFQSNPGTPLMVASPPIGGSSGEKAGIQKGDLVYSINGKSTEGMTAIQVLDIMSNDRSSEVNLEVASGANPSAKKTISLVRSTEKAKNPVTYSVETLKDSTKVGYISLGEFNSEAVRGLSEAIAKVQESDVKDIVLDVRGNTGGGFQFALNIGGMFMDNKEMATAKGKDTIANVFRTSYPEGVLTDKPLILLVDGLSASASEVLAGGLHDNCRAVLVGSKTFGKGKIQAVFGLADGEGLTMTVAQYVTPRGTIIQSKGLQPDIPLETLNPYIAHIAGPLSKPDLNLIDFHRAEDIAKTCSATSSPSVTSN